MADAIRHRKSCGPLAALLLVCAMAAPAAAQTVVPETQEQITLSFAPIVRQTAPAVVNIYTRRVVENRFGLFDDPFFRRFFGEDFNFGIPSERVQNSLGSGVIVRSDGLVITNHHVVAGSEEITVVLSDGREYEAEPVLMDERTDIAVLRIDTRGQALPHLPIGDSDDLEVGDLVLAIGNPFGVGQTVTSGIVSALARTQVGVSDYRFFIQTDAAINPGNSGGALVALDGTLVGINTAIYSRQGGGSIGIGFAIPANMVATLIAAAETGNIVIRPWIGATGQPVTAELAEGFGLDRPGGVLVNGLHPGGPAEKAGIETGDIILAVNGREVVDPQGMRFRLATLAVGSQAELLILRDGQEIRIAVDLIAAPEDPPAERTVVEARSPMEGATVANLSPALAEELAMDSSWTGVAILGVDPESTARRMRFRAGDIILEVNGVAIDRVATLIDTLNAGGSRWQFTIKRGDRVQTFTIG
ncbi:MAG: Do family serine endopeptidase [Rhodospirillaceae bacterium]|nr:Do family serine endopeptidase [Rhodospirillaceae bacterium]